MVGPDIKIRSLVEKEMTVTENGQKITKLVPVSFGLTDSSLKLYFTLTITNEGDEVAANVVVDNPIPPGTIYAIGSATGEKSVVTCSMDNGVSFHAENEQIAQPIKCTDIRWVVEDIPVRTTRTLCFQVIIGALQSDIGAVTLEQKNKPPTVVDGRARFEARNLSRQMREVTSRPQQHEKEALAQSPKEIRRKLEAQKYQTSGGRASFTAKDIEPIVPATSKP